eukprot:1157417-Pelagomonas_calceolata.AAC.3
MSPTPAPDASVTWIRLWTVHDAVCGLHMHHVAYLRAIRICGLNMQSVTCTCSLWPGHVARDLYMQSVTCICSLWPGHVACGLHVLTACAQCTQGKQACSCVAQWIPHPAAMARPPKSSAPWLGFMHIPGPCMIAAGSADGTCTQARSACSDFPPRFSSWLSCPSATRVCSKHEGSSVHSSSPSPPAVTNRGGPGCAPLLGCAVGGN